MNSKQLRTVAAVTMLIDHIGEIFLTAFTPEWYIVRGIGRMAFPIFCFLIVEGFVHTRSLAKYAGRLALFALISELPYNLAFSKTMIDMESRNVFVTLLLGLAAITAAGRGAKWALEKLHAPEKLANNVYFQALCALPVIALCAVAAELLGADYGWGGVMMIFVLYLFRDNKALSFLALTAVNSFALCMQIMPPSPMIAGDHIHLRVFRTIQWIAPLAYLLIGMYNGEKGKVRWRWFFYIYYPAHLIILWLVWLIFV